jgi:hypothetical protein
MSLGKIAFGINGPVNKMPLWGIYGPVVWVGGETGWGGSPPIIWGCLFILYFRTSE